MELILEMISAVFGFVMPPVLIIFGIWFGIRLKFFYIIHPIRTFKLMWAKRGDGISPFRAATMALAGTLGVGNITGVVAAIASGGAGAVFWMWVSALVAMSVKYAETALAVVYRRRDRDGWYGGAPYYIADGLPVRRGAALAIAAFFALLCMLNSFTVGNILQVNAAASSASELTGVSPYTVGIVLAVLTAAAVTGGADRISRVTAVIIPAVSALYMLMCAAVIVMCAGDVPYVMGRIFTDAFSLRAAVGGGSGYMISVAVRYGVTRGVLTNEAGSGTSPTAHACADAYSPESQGCLGIFEVFADTIIICTLTAIAVLAAGGGDIPTGADAMRSTADAFSSVLGAWSDLALAISVFVFVLATLLSQHYYGRVALRFLGGGKLASVIYTAVFLAVVVYGAGVAPPVVWLLSDITVGSMTTVNVICLYMMRRRVPVCDLSSAVAARERMRS